MWLVFVATKQLFSILLFVQQKIRHLIIQTKEKKETKGKKIELVCGCSNFWSETTEWITLQVQGNF